MHYLAQNIARLLARNSRQEIDEDVVRYGAEVTLGAMFQIVLYLSAAWLCGLVQEMIGILAASAFLRLYAGGAHCSAYYRCTLSGLVTYMILAWVSTFLNPQYYYWYFVAVALMSYVLVYLRAPVDNPANRIDDEVKRDRLKRMSMIVLAVLLVISALLFRFQYFAYAAVILVGLLWQAFTLTPGGEIYINSWDRFLLGIEKLVGRREDYAK